MSRRTKLLIAAPLAVPLLLVIAWFIFTMHWAWEIPAEHRPPASWSQRPDGGIALRSLGVSGFELNDGTTTVLVDPAPTRPTPFALITGTIEPDAAIGEKWAPRADFILVNHAHFDHVLDVGLIARRTGATVIGSQNTVNFALSYGVPPEKTRVVKPGDHFTIGTFTVDVRETRHTDILVAKPMSGVISPLPRTMWFFQYALDDTLAYRLEANGASVWFHPTSTWAPGECAGLEAKTLIVGVTGEKQTPEKVKGLLAETKAHRVLPTHFDNFFQPVDRGLALMPGLDLDAARDLFKQADPSLEWGVIDLNETVFLPPD